MFPKWIKSIGSFRILPQDPIGSVYHLGYFEKQGQSLFSGAADALRLLYKYGANQLHVDKDSLTGILRKTIDILFSICSDLALHCAAICGHTSCIGMLVEQFGCPLDGLSKIFEYSSVYFKIIQEKILMVVQLYFMLLHQIIQMLVNYYLI